MPSFKPRKFDVSAGFLTMSNQVLDEGNSGTANMTFVATLATTQPKIVKFDYTTQDGTGVAGQDYTSVAGTKTIAIGATTANIDVPILGDTSAESDETFTLRISNIRFVRS